MSVFSTYFASFQGEKGVTAGGDRIDVGVSAYSAEPRPIQIAFMTVNLFKVTRKVEARVEKVSIG